MRLWWDLLTIDAAWALSQESSLFETPRKRGTTAPSIYFCTGYEKKTWNVCTETFRRKSDWERHERTFHETPAKWICSWPDCDSEFREATRIWSHHKAHHACAHCIDCDGSATSIHVASAQVQLTQKVAWGCGFCGELLSSWKDRCDHMDIVHFKSWDAGSRIHGRHEWDDTREIQGLLKRPELRNQWEEKLESHSGAELGEVLVWNRPDDDDLILRLQCSLDEADVGPLLDELYQRSSPSAHFEDLLYQALMHDEVTDIPLMRGTDIFDPLMQWLPNAPSMMKEFDMLESSNAAVEHPVWHERLPMGKENIAAAAIPLRSTPPEPQATSVTTPLDHLALNQWAMPKDSSALMESISLTTGDNPFIPMPASYDGNIAASELHPTEIELQSGELLDYFAMFIEDGAYDTG